MDWIIIYLLLIISILGIICNIGVIIIIWCNQKPGSSFLINLSCADLCFSLSVCIILAINIYNSDWTNIMCDISGVMSALCGCQILLSLALISIERYLIIVHIYRLSSRQILIMIMGSWLYSMLISLCPLFGWNRIILQSSRIYCISDWAQTNIGRGYTLLCALTLWGSVILACLLYIRIQKHIKTVADNVSPYINTQFSYIQERRATKRLFMIILIVFLIWSLYGINFMYQLIFHTPSPYYLDLFSYLMVILGGIINPFVYVLTTKAYREMVYRNCCSYNRSPVVRFSAT